MLGARVGRSRRVDSRWRDSAAYSTFVVTNAHAMLTTAHVAVAELLQLRLDLPDHVGDVAASAGQLNHSTVTEPFLHFSFC